MLSKARIPYIIFAFVLLTVPCMLWKMQPNYFIISTDLPAYYAAAKLMTSGRAAQVYDPKAVRQEALIYFPDIPAKKEFLFVAEPPLVMPAFAIFSFLTPLEAKILSEAVGITATLLALFLLADLLQFSLKDTTTLILLTAFVVPYWSVIRIHKPTPILLLGLCLTLYFLKKNKNKAASLSSILCFIKPQVFLPFLAFAAGARQFKYIFATAGVGLALALCSLAMFGVDGWSAYIKLLLKMSSEPLIVGVTDMPTLKGLLYRLAIDPGIANSISSLGFAATLCFLLWFGNKFVAHRQWWLPAVAASSIIGLITGIHAHLYDFVMIIPATAIFLKHEELAKEKFTQRVLWIVIGLLVVPAFLLINPINDKTGLHWHFISLAIASISAIVSVRTMIPKTADGVTRQAEATLRDGEATPAAVDSDSSGVAAATIGTVPPGIESTDDLNLAAQSVDLTKLAPLSDTNVG